MNDLTRKITTKYQDEEIGIDGLPVLLQGPWSREKLHFVSYFSSLFNGGMKSKWSHRIYVDLFSGPGICRDRTNGEEFWGSPFQALSCATPFTELIFNDVNTRFIDALKVRQEREFPEANVRYHNLDCNAAASKIGSGIPDDALVLAFVDPWTYEITFDALTELAQSSLTDLIVTFHTTPIKRNVQHEIQAVDRFLGDTSWRDRYWKASGDPSNPPTHVLLEIFKENLRERLGYQFFGIPMVIRNTTGSPMYHVVFASHHSRGLDFWQKTLKIMPNGQRTLF